MSKRVAPIDNQTHAKLKRSKTVASSGSTADMPPTRATKRILVVGLAGHAPGRPISPSAKLPKGQFRKMLQKMAAEAKENGLDLEMMQVKSSAFPSGLQDIKERLKSEPDGLLIGNGIRGTAEYTVFFEDLVNACREITPATRLAFNTSPTDILECCLRNFK